ncbi:dual specificity protein phosphatase 2-like [Bradysia coprophila]|uniref:dual specificity protein phosphatase 2-like n=1 Tax=Bradysia coprophila TaxID=38358 RepID=UPI00187D905F|nr:dual specificity protein phosphatase 2-like [Bradysia coprophila]
MSSGDISEIYGNLFLGSAKASKSLNLLTTHGITHIVNIAGRQHFSDQFVYKRVHFEDVEEFDEVDKLREIFSWLDAVLADTKSKVLVHCMGGISRSASVVCGYLVWSKKFKLDESVAFVKSRRPQIRPRQLEAVRRIEVEVQNSENN